MIVQHNLTAMNANRMLGLTTSAQAKSTEKLSSGFKINRAADDAAGLSISEKMRKQIRGLTQASDNAQDGISCVQTAEGALTEVHSMLQRMNELAVKASNGTLTNETDRKAVQTEVDALITEIDRVSETTKFNDMYLLKGDKDAVKDITTVTLSLTDTAKAAQESTIDVGAKAAYAPEATDAIKGGTTTVPASVTFTDKGGGTNHLYGSLAGDWSDTAEITAANVKDYFDVAADGTLTAKTGATYGVAASSGAAAGGTKTLNDLTTDGWIAGVAESTVTGKSELNDYLEIDSNGKLKYKEGKILYTDPGQTTTDFGDQIKDKAIAEADLDQYFKISGNPLTDEKGNKVTEDKLGGYFKEGIYQGGLYKRTDAADPNSITEIGADQIKDFIHVDKKAEQVAEALEFNLHVGSEWYENNKISVKIEAMSSVGIGVDVLRTDGLLTEDDATNAIETISKAIQKVSDQRSALGAVQNRLEHTIANLDNIVENTTSAESRIRDVDMAEEMVEYSKNNILAQAGQSMLAQANQINQGVLSLLG